MTDNQPDDIVVVAAARTPIGKLNGALASVSAVELGAVAIKAALARGGLDAGEVDAVIMGNVLQAGLGQAPARQAAVAAGIGWDVPANTVNKVCLSGLTAIIDAARMIRCKDAAVAVAGGMESMSGAPHLLMDVRTGWPYGDRTVVDSAAHDGLSDAWSHEAMGLDTDRRTVDYPASREEQDAVAARSQQLAAKAAADGVFDDEIAPVTTTRHREDVIVSADEGIRSDTTLEGLAKLRPAFRPGGTLTAGNSSTINDGAAAVVMTTRVIAESRGWMPLATLRTWAQVAGPSAALAPQPGNATLAALKRQGWTLDDLDLLEINEAFAAITVHAVQQLGVLLEKVNIHGGAIALGHPIGMSGARLVVHLAYELHRRGHGRAVAALCGGTGQGDAILMEA